ncbi:MAG: hypothetical protein ACYDEX_26655 [Mobilitalea sp.]
MKLKNIALEYCNTVFVADKASDFAMVYQARKILGENVSIYNTDKKIVFQKPDEKIQAEYMSNKLIVGIHKIESDLNQSIANSLAIYAVKFFDTIKDTTVNSYGFNFLGNAELEESCTPAEYCNSIFFPKSNEYEVIINAKFLGINPNFTLEKDGCIYSVTITPINEKELEFHCNAHYEKPFDLNVENLANNILISFSTFIRILSTLKEVN